jgi:hypothetical protein
VRLSKNCESAKVKSTFIRQIFKRQIATEKYKKVLGQNLVLERKENRINSEQKK